MKISWSKEGGRVVSKAWDAGRRGKGTLDVGVSFIPRGSKTGWVFPRCRADGSRKSMVRERYMLANSGRFSRRECRVGASSTSGRRLDVLDGQNQVGKEGKFRSGPRTGKDLRSFAEVVAAPLVVGSDRLAPRAFGEKDGRMSVSFSSSEVAAGEQKFKTSVVLSFFKRRPLADHLKTFIESRWKIVGRFSFSELWDSNHVIVLLENETDVRKALSCQLRKVGSCAFKAFRWFSEYDPRQKQKSFKTWISLPDLPLCLFDKSYVESIISGFAKLLFIDEKSERCTNLRCMRARIEVVDREVIPDKMWIKLPKERGYWQFFQVEEVSRSDRKVEDPAIVNFPAKEDEVLSDTVSRPCFDVAAGFQTKESHCEQGEESEWQLISRRNSKKTSTLSPSNSGKRSSADGMFSTDEKLKVTQESSKSIFECDNRDTEPSNGDHVPFGVGQSARLDFSPTSDLQSQNQIMLYNAKDWHAVPRRNKSNKRKSDKKGLMDSGTAHGHGDPIGEQPYSEVPTHNFGSEEHELADPIEIKQLSEGPTHDFGSVEPISHVTARTSNSTLVISNAASAVRSVASAQETSCHGTIVLPMVPEAELPSRATPAVLPPNTAAGLSSRATPAELSPNTAAALSCRATAAELPSVNSNRSLASPISQPKVVHCDSLELLRKKKGRFKLAEEKEGQNDQTAIVPMLIPDDKIASYGTDFVCYDEDFVPLDARALYLRLKAEHSDEADIFHVMDHVMDQLYKSASGAQNDIPGEDSDGFIDLSRILKHPRRKSKGSRNSGRSCPKKKGSKVVY